MNLRPQFPTTNAVLLPSVLSTTNLNADRKDLVQHINYLFADVFKLQLTSFQVLINVISLLFSHVFSTQPSSILQSLINVL